MNEAIHAAPRGQRLARFFRIVWLMAWAVAGLLLLTFGTDTEKTHFLMWPVWLALAPWLWRRISFIGRGIIYGYSAMLCFVYAGNPNFEFDGFREESCFEALMFGSLAGLVIAVSRYGLRPDSPVSERILRTAAMTLALIALSFCCFMPHVRT